MKGRKIRQLVRDIETLSKDDVELDVPARGRYGTVLHATSPLNFVTEYPPPVYHETSTDQV